MRENLKIAMTRENVTSEMLGKVLGIHRNSVSNKINNESKFYVDEAKTIWQTFFRQYDFQWLFSAVSEESAS